MQGPIEFEVCEVRKNVAHRSNWEQPYSRDNSTRADESTLKLCALYKRDISAA